MAECRSEKEQFWRLVLEEQTSSGLSIRAFCKQEGLSEPSFYSWRRTISERDSNEPESGGTWQRQAESRESVISNDRQQSNPSFIPVQVVQELPDDPPGASERHDEDGDDQAKCFEIEPGTILAGNNGSWSIHGRLLPFCEQANAYNMIDLDVA